MSSSSILMLCLFFRGGFGISYGSSNFLNFGILSLTLWWRVAAHFRFDLSNVGIGTKVRRFLIRFLAIHLFTWNVALDSSWLLSGTSRSLELIRMILSELFNLDLLFALRLSCSLWLCRTFILNLTADSQRLTFSHLRLLLLILI